MKGENLSLDRMFDLLANQRRRELLVALSKYATPISLPRLADEITEAEYGVPSEQRPKERHRIYMSLYHTHVPKLEDSHVVSYTQSDDSIEWGENASILLTYLDRLPPSELPSFESDRQQRTGESTES